MKAGQNHLVKNTFLCVIMLLATGALFIGSPQMIMGDSGNGDIVIKAMKDEMDRSMKSLKIENMEKPYYLEYVIADYWQMEIEGSFGSLTKSEETHRRTAKVGIRVGSSQLDNTGFLSRSSMFSVMMGGTGPTVIDDDYNALRHELWLATDKAYKSALEQLAGKKAYLKNQAQSEEIPDFSKEESVQKILPRKTMKIDRGKWEKTVKELSAVFRQFPAVYESHVDMRIVLNNKYFTNSEGTVVCQPEPLVSLAAYAETQAADGMKLKHYIPFYAPTLEGLPNEKELTAGIKKMAEELTALASAPVLENYIGPVLFTGQASAELFTQVLVPHLSGERPPLSDMPQMSQMSTPSALVNRLNRKIFPREISIIDDPTQTDFAGQALIGSYAVDDQGVVSRSVTLVENGVLKTLLMSRRPRKEIANSNGHARSPLMGSSGVQIGNLFIAADKGKTYRDLKKELLQLCEDQQLPFGLIVKTFDNPAITGMEMSVSLFMRGSQPGTTITSPVMVYRVYVEDGREELVRGIALSGLEVDDLKDIAAVGNDSYLHHRILSSGGGMMGSIFMIFSSQGRSGMGVPASIAAPSVLFEEVEFKKQEEKAKKPPLMPHPFFAK
jgi:TldD protein